MAALVPRLPRACSPGACCIPGKSTDTETHTLKPRFVVAIDTSQSMNLSAEEGTPNRWAKAQEALALSWTKTVAAECEIDVYAFNGETSKSLGLNEIRFTSFPTVLQAASIRDGHGKNYRTLRRT